MIDLRPILSPEDLVTFALNEQVVHTIKAGARRKGSRMPAASRLLTGVVPQTHNLLEDNSLDHPSFQMFSYLWLDGVMIEGCVVEFYTQTSITSLAWLCQKTVYYVCDRLDLVLCTDGTIFSFYQKVRVVDVRVNVAKQANMVAIKSKTLLSRTPMTHEQEQQERLHQWASKQ